jgi:protein-S-isoprenylcysteine O-methyltransferase Ste14
VVRIQKERGHRVVSGGPYRWLRHPMFAGVILQNVATPLMPGSAWAFAPAGAIIPAVIARTHLEDRTLRQELAGIAQYGSPPATVCFPASGERRAYAFMVGRAVAI